MVLNYILNLKMLLIYWVIYQKLVLIYKYLIYMVHYQLI